MWFIKLRASAGISGYVWGCGLCASVWGCARVCRGVRECAWVWAGMHRYARVWEGVHGCVQVCMDMHGCAQVCGMNFQNFFWRIESLHKRTLIRILYEFFCLYLLLVVERNSQKLEPHPNYKNFVLDCMPFLPRPKKAVLKSLIFSPILMTISHRGGHLEILSI